MAMQRQALVKTLVRHLLRKDHRHLKDKQQLHHQYRPRQIRLPQLHNLQHLQGMRMHLVLLRKTMMMKWIPRLRSYLMSVSLSRNREKARSNLMQKQEGLLKQDLAKNQDPVLMQRLPTSRLLKLLLKMKERGNSRHV